MRVGSPGNPLHPSVNRSQFTLLKVVKLVFAVAAIRNSSPLLSPLYGNHPGGASMR
jgi:hypothetical protein